MSLLLGSRTEAAFGLHFAGPGVGCTGLLGEGDVSTNTTDCPALRDARVFWRKKKGIFTELWLSRRGAVGYVAPDRAESPAEPTDTQNLLLARKSSTLQLATPISDLGRESYGCQDIRR